MITDPVPVRVPRRLLPVLVIVALQSWVTLTPGRDPFLQLAVAVLLLLQVQWMARVARQYEHDGPHRSIELAGLCLAAGLVADVVARAVGPDLPMSVGFIVGSSLCAVFAFQAVLRWDRLGSGTPGVGDWINALGTVAVTVSGGILLVQALAAPAAAWSGWELLVWLGQLATGAVLAGTCVVVGLLTGMRGDPRLWAVVGAFSVHVVVQCAIAAAGYEVAERASILGHVVVCTATTAALQQALPVRRDRTRPSVTATWSLVLLGCASLVLAVAAFSDLARTRVAAAIGAAATVVTFSRVSAIVRELESLARARREARTDDLTGLANRRGLVAALTSAPGTVRDRREAALLVLDLGGFKHVNDRYGPDTGDHVLRAVAGRVAGLLEGRHVLARVTGDEFAVLLPGADQHRALDVAAAVADAVTQPFDVPDAVVRLGVHVGVTHVHPDERPAPAGTELLRRGQAAMYAARAAGTQVAAYDPAEDERERLRHERVEQLRGLLAPEPDPACGEVVVHFQPQLDAGTGEVVGAEALVRWWHPQHGLLAPVAFVDLVERHGLMAPLTRRVLRLAAHEAAGWARAGFPYRVSVNLSSSSFADGDVVCLVQEALTATGLEPGLLTLEITESVLMENVESVPPVLQSLAERGVGLSIDDFGTGYSSLAYLADLPVDELKIDRSFVRRLMTDPRTHAVVAGTIELARRLQLRVVAEGVEDAETLEALRELGCDVSQGYLHARPAPAAELRDWFQDHVTADQPS
ncbi:bifunctional diguanylate cyclase/phosphodiesterase [Aeromicrobium sp. IC_218]|uniref:putative bifunctional diguanylate cyclase/phosphodiesterase n=1 Tax=Aeromicrobium sp. IC_218 TaxID=2545468 RepID=UPI00103B99D1|nr:bifunctional diguanylate cyclase/phosphodiesterase [Aeromicrobium sp. IC_218]TCI95913.1 bifunctional diguanylate cyclase/phosphodiesterase [Aeromicrobium sp. IC_218]